MNFVFDIDGTLCFDGQHIDNRIISRLKQLQSYGHQVIFASARPIRDLLPVIPDFQNNTLIGGNGSIISTDNKIKVIDYINQDDFELIKEL
ncbi:HAD-IIB family hydrolase, partial [Staphylococcus lugdunensis]